MELKFDGPAEPRSQGVWCLCIILLIAFAGVAWILALQQAAIFQLRREAEAMRQWQTVINERQKSIGWLYDK